MSSFLSHAAWHTALSAFMEDEVADMLFGLLESDVFEQLEHEADRRVHAMCERGAATRGAAVPNTMICSDELVRAETDDVFMHFIAAKVAEQTAFVGESDQEGIALTFESLFELLLKARRTPLLWGELDATEREWFEGAFWSVIWSLPDGQSYVHTMCLPADNNPVPAEVMFITLLVRGEATVTAGPPVDFTDAVFFADK